MSPRARRLETRTLLVAAALSLSGLAACHRDVVIVEPPGLVRPTVPAGAAFHVVLETPLGPDRSEAGDLVVARLAEPLRASEGYMVVPAGARVLGHVLDVDDERDRSVTIRFETLVTDTTVHPIAAQVIDAGRGVAVSSIAAGDAPEIWDSVLAPLEREPRGVGGGPPPACPTPGAVQGPIAPPLLPPGTRLLVLLQRPIVDP